MQRENKWQDRFDEKFIPKGKISDKPINKEGTLYGITYENPAVSFEDIKSFIQSEIDTTIAERDKEWEKAFKKTEKQYFIVPSDMNSRLYANTSAYLNFIKNLIK